jgi:hypothetical protein
MGYALSSFLLAAVLFTGILICFEIGRRFGTRFRRRFQGIGLIGTGPIETAVFALLGLLVAFTFYGAAGRFDTRRELIVEEANEIGTAYLRIDLLPANVQPEIREAFRNYVDSRLEFYKSLSEADAGRNQLAHSSDLQQQIWQKSVSASEAQGAHRDAGKLLLPALNSMIDITSTRAMALQMHPPTIIFAMLFGLTFLGSVLAGYGMAGGARSWLYVVAFAGVMAIAVYVILDLEYPRFGLIRVDRFDQMLVDLRNSMK